MAIAGTTDVAARLGRELTTSESAWVETLLDDAEDLILVRIPDLMDRLQADPPTAREDAVVRAECYAVIRVLRNPDGRYQESIAGEYNYTRDRVLSDGQLRILDEEIDGILVSASDASDAFTIRLIPDVG